MRERKFYSAFHSEDIPLVVYKQGVKQQSTSNDEELRDTYWWSGWK